MNNKSGAYNVFIEINCAVCGKKFKPAPEHALKIGAEGSRNLVCSYSCMRKYEKEHDLLRRDEILQKRDQKRKDKKC